MSINFQSRNLKRNRIIRNSIFFLLLFIISFLLATRSESSPDTAAYRWIYDNSFHDLNYEILYLWLCRMFNTIGVGFVSFLFILTFFLFLFWHRLTKHLTNHIFIAFISFLPFYGLYYFGIILRASIAILICYLAIVILLKNKNIKGHIFYFLLIFIAFGFHQSTLIFLLLPIFVQKEYNGLTLYISLIIISLIPLLNNLIPIVNDIGLKFINLTDSKRLSGYLINSDDKFSYSLTFYKSLFLAAVFIYLRNHIKIKKYSYNFFLNIYLFGCLLLALFSNVTAGSRFGNQFLFFEFILIALLYDSTKINKVYKYSFIILIIIINSIALVQKTNGFI